MVTAVRVVLALLLVGPACLGPIGPERAPASASPAALAKPEANPKRGTERTEVVGWVPAYAIDKSIAALKSSPLIGKALTRIGLQLWNPSADGRVVYAPADAQGTPFNVQEIASLRDWAHARGIEVLLTVYNNSEVMKEWDWALAESAFALHRSEFVNALAAAVEQHGLDGVDVDLEGLGELDADRAPFAAFVRELSSTLRARGKLLSIDSFHSPCANAPNMSWWVDWVGQVDALHSMGYADLYEGSTDTFTPAERGAPCVDGAALFRYSWQQNYGLKAGYSRSQVVLGLPTWVGEWGKAGTTGQGSTALAHLKEVKALGAGIALWDLQLEAAAWRSDAVWRAVAELREP